MFNHIELEEIERERQKLATYTFQEIKTFLETSIKNGIEAELKLYLNHQEYMIIIYEDHCSFQRCSYQNGSGEYYFSGLDALYQAKQIDDICLERDWDKIEDWECFEFDLQNLW